MEPRTGSPSTGRSWVSASVHHRPRANGATLSPGDAAARTGDGYPQPDVLAVMSERGGVWRLARGEEILADLVVTGGDLPWLNAQVHPAPGFEDVRPLFDDELRRLDHLDDDPGPWEAAYLRIRQTVHLLAPDGRPVPEFLLHIDGDQAW